MSSRPTLTAAGRDLLLHLTGPRGRGTRQSRPSAPNTDSAAPNGRLLPVDVTADVIVDVRGLRFIDAVGLGALIELRNEFAAAGFTFVLVNPSPMLRRLCDICSLAALLGEPDPDIRETVR